MKLAKAMKNLIYENLKKVDKYKYYYRYYSSGNNIVFGKRIVTLQDQTENVEYTYRKDDMKSIATLEGWNKGVHTERRVQDRFIRNSLMLYALIENKKPAIYNKNSRIAKKSKNGGYDLSFMDGLYSYHLPEDDMKIAVYKLSGEKIVIREEDDDYEYFCSPNGMVTYDRKENKIVSFTVGDETYDVHNWTNIHLLPIISVSEIVPMINNQYEIFDTKMRRNRILTQSTNELGIVNHVEDSNMHDLMNFVYDTSICTTEDIKLTPERRDVVHINSYPILIDPFDPFIVFKPFTHYAMDIITIERGLEYFNIEFERYIYDFNPFTQETKEQLFNLVD